MSAYLRKYGAATTVLFPLVTKDSQVLLAGATIATGDAKISKDEGAFANTGSVFVDEGSGMYSVALTGTEMEAARISILIVDQTDPAEWEDQVIVIDTYGHASAQHAFDLDTATQDVNVASIDADTITAASIAANAITDSEFSATVSLSDAVITKVADAVLRQTLDTAEAASGTHLENLSEKSLCGVISAIIVGFTKLNANTIRHYKSDGATKLFDRTVVVDRNALPVTGLSITP